MVVDNQYTVMDLQTGQPYEFRVVAHNTAGVGEHSLPSMAASPKNPDGKLTTVTTNGLSLSSQHRFKTNATVIRPTTCF